MVDLALILLVFVIGVGSLLFHTNATRWAEIADVAPITAFMLAYVGYTLRRFVGLSWMVTLFGIGLFYVLAWQAGEMRCEGVRCLNGSASYIPALAVLLGAGIALLLMRRPVAVSLIAGGIIFAVSLTFRTFDNAWCGAVMSFDGGPLGTHFLWHCLNATLLFVLLRAAVHHGGVYRAR